MWITRFLGTNWGRETRVLEQSALICITKLHNLGVPQKGFHLTGLYTLRKASQAAWCEGNLFLEFINNWGRNLHFCNVFKKNSYTLSIMIIAMLFFFFYFLKYMCGYELIGGWLLDGIRTIVSVSFCWVDLIWFFFLFFLPLKTKLSKTKVLGGFACETTQTASISSGVPK